MPNWFRNLGIAVKISLLLSLTATVFLLILSASTYYVARQELQHAIAASQSSLVNTLAAQLDEKLLASHKYLKYLAVHLSRQHGTAPEAAYQRILNDHDASLNYFDAGVLVLSPQGRIMAELPFRGGDRIGVDHSQREYYRQVIQTGKPFVSEPYRLTLPAAPLVTAFSLPVFAQNGRLTAVIVGRLSLEKQGGLRLLNTGSLGKHGYYYLINSQRTILVHPDQQRVASKVPHGSNKALDAALQGWSGTRENVNYVGVIGLTSVQALKEAPWFLAVHYPLSEAYAPLHRAMHAFAVVSVVLIGLMLIVVWLFVQLLLRPLRRLTEHMQHLALTPGENRVLAVESHDEIGRLTSVFNTLLHTLGEQAEIREEHLRISQMISQFTSEMAVWRMLDGSIRFISGNCQELTGYRDAEFYENPGLLDSLVHPDDHEMWGQHNVVVAGQDSHPPFAVRLITKDGLIRWMQHTCYLTHDAAGAISGRRGNFSDITSLVAMQEVLNQEKAFIENLLNSAATPIFVINNRHEVLFWNQALEIMTGISRYEVIGTSKHWLGFYQEKRVTLSDLVVDGVTDLNTYYSNHSRSKFVTGGYRVEEWFELNNRRHYLLFEAAPIKNSKGEIIAAIESFEDITEHRVMEEAVRRLTTAVDQTGSAIVITDADGVIEFVNPSFSTLTGYSAEEAVGRKPSILKSGETPEEVYAELWRTINSGKVWKGQFHNRRKDGSFFWEEASISPLLDKHGVITGYLAVKEDISEQKAAREQLTHFRDELETKHIELEAAFKKIELATREWEETLDQLHDFIVLTDTTHRIRRYNKILANLTGLGANDLVGKDWRDIVKQAGFSFVSYVGERGELLHNRSGRSYDLNLYPITTNGIKTGYVVSLNDTTELRATTNELERALAELNEAQLQIFQQEKMASVGQLAAGVAHEINNPMGFIASNLGSLEKYLNRLTEFIAASDQVVQQQADHDEAEALQELRKKLKVDYILEDAHQLIAESMDGASRVRRIVQDLKSFSRVDSAEIALVNLNDALETTINIAWNEIKYVADLKREFGDIPQIRCYPQQLNQVFLNLLINAAHSMEGQHGVITVRTEQEGDFVNVSIQDTGCGIPDEVRTRIFEPFFTTKEVGKGTGLGLSISYDIVKKHGGDIFVESESGQGTTFTVHLPIELPVKEPLA